ncbi:MAG: hypothetical protein ABGX47_00680 [Martelella sp.]|uniref:hypothetical protein n=1 Tax=Martelella sp. TaxID=1969699 RepID=UPI003242407E
MASRNSVKGVVEAWRAKTGRRRSSALLTYLEAYFIPSQGHDSGLGYKRQDWQISLMDYRHICTAGMVAHHDLLTAHEALEAGPESLSLRLVLMRHLMLEIANVADLAAIAGALYKDNPELGELQRPIRNGLEFFKYLRNVYVGHFVSDLTDKTFEWMPHMNALVGKSRKEDQMIVSWFALETAINTYADPETGHKIFDSDTDLNYPPDQTRFFNFLGETALGSIAYIARLIVVTRGSVDVPNLEEGLLELSMIAGQTGFAVLTRKKKR